MSLFITSLASGSNGNCYYVGNKEEAVLIDAGISCREIERRMNRLGLLLSQVKALFISHEHSDHIQGVPVLAKKWNIPVYITTATQQKSRLPLHGHSVHSFCCQHAVSIGKLSVTAFSKAHDAIDPHSFTVSYNGICVGVFTDIGRPCAQLIQHFNTCHAAFLEANYDETLLATGHYPAHLKMRIRGGKGHLSNRQAFELFCTHRSNHLSHLILAHLSKNNNCPELVKTLFSTNARNTEVIVATRYAETPVYEIRSQKSPTSMKPQHAASAPQLAFSF